MIQRPEKKLEVAIVINGKQGTGKSTLTNVMLTIYGRHGIEVVNPHHITGHFNAPLQPVQKLVSLE